MESKIRPTLDLEQFLTIFLACQYSLISRQLKEKDLFAGAMLFNAITPRSLKQLNYTTSINYSLFIDVVNRKYRGMVSLATQLD
jgi:hypothetical protein